MIAMRTKPAYQQSLDAMASMIRAASPYALLACIGVELALLTAFLPGTIDRLLHGPVADFHNLYEPARDRELPGLYSPFLILVLQPIAWLPEMQAYRMFFVLNAACIVAIGIIAQRAVHSWEARTVVALAPIALPQVHWALRLGHLTPIIALIALIAFMALREKPTRAAVLLSLLALKPQYLVAPMAYLVTARQWRPLAITFGLAGAMAFGGMALVGPGAVPELAARYLDWAPNSTDNLLPIQQSWMVSWPGVQISLGMEVHPLITLDLVLLSLAIAVCAWLRTDRPLHGAVIALMLIPLTPYAQFYDGLLVLVAIALILGTNLVTPVRAGLCVGLYAAAVATQSSVVFPVKDVLGPAHTEGVYWLAPAMVAAVGVFVLAGRTSGPPDEGGA